MPLYCCTLCSDRSLLSRGESEALTEGQGDPETPFDSAGNKATMMQTPMLPVSYVNGAPWSCAGHRLHASKQQRWLIQPWGRTPAPCPPAQAAGLGRQQNTELLTAWPPVPQGSCRAWDSQASSPHHYTLTALPKAVVLCLAINQNHLCRCGKLHMPILIQVWGEAQIRVVLKGPQVVQMHSQGTAGPHMFPEHYQLHPRLPIVSWSTIPKLPSPAQLSSLCSRLQTQSLPEHFH